ncbi:hypothetical protein BU25DRAFT_192146 [Macroventuria anomochaeta]|uniref:Uncharacterized protein n=1 Tax=Macroventuria anomochaeta TaxID=301207 RepID=A0ACB6SBN0_9PLEO|nr:uncharacterized protein BU25DRAFT_192146 [Macroventuria anomochaeta]KAF2631621.1 hypothetical protein BU25DRAFT_192146 [Macroventuria anomochaeta]
MRKSQVAGYFANTKQTSLTTRSSPAILPRLPAAGVPNQIAQLTRARNNNAALLEHIKADPLWLARRMLGQEIFMSPNRCFKFDTYYLAEEGTVCIVQGAQKLTPEQRKMVDEHENVFFNVPDLLPAMEVLRAHVEFKFLVVPVYTVHQIMMQTDALMTVGHIVPKGENSECADFLLAQTEDVLMV